VDEMAEVVRGPVPADPDTFLQFLECWDYCIYQDVYALELLAF